MKPPICEICDDRFLSGGGLIYFTQDENDKKFNERLKIKGFVGHPTNAFWFCEKHIYIARKYSDLVKTQALPKIRTEITEFENQEKPDKSKE